MDRIQEMVEMRGRPHEDERRSRPGDRRRWRQHPDRQARSPAPRRWSSPNHFEAANAVGAAIAQISGEVDRVYCARHDVAR